MIFHCFCCLLLLMPKQLLTDGSMTRSLASLRGMVLGSSAGSCCSLDDGVGWGGLGSKAERRGCFHSY